MKKDTLVKRLKGYVGTRSLSSPATGNAVSNQVVVNFENASVFESYGTLIAVKKDDKIYLSKDYNYSRTTSKYLNQFCGMTSKEVEKELKNKNPRFVMLK